MEMGKIRTVLLVAVAAIAGALCLGALTGCQNDGYSGVAATVNGVEIKEEKVTQQIQDMRKRNNLDTKDAFGNYLVESDSDAEKIRKDYIDSLAEDELIRQAAEKNGIEVSAEEIDASIEGMKANFTDAEWKTALSEMSTTEEAYRENIEKAITRLKVARAFIEKAEPGDEDYTNLVATYANRFDGAKKTAHVMFALDDKKTAEKVLKQIQDGDISFEDAVEKYSIDHASASKGDAGWNSWSTMSPEYLDAVAKMKKDEVSKKLVKDAYGYHIIKVTGEYTAPETAEKKKDLPAAFLATLETVAKESKGAEDFQTWLTDIKDNADIVINDMPANAPYNFDLTKYKEAKEKADAEANANNAEAEDGTVESDDTSTADEGTVAEESGDDAADTEEGAAEEASNENGVTITSDGAEVEVNDDGTLNLGDAASNANDNSNEKK